MRVILRAIQEGQSIRLDRLNVGGKPGGWIYQIYDPMEKNNLRKNDELIQFGFGI